MKRRVHGVFVLQVLFMLWIGCPNSFLGAFAYVSYFYVVLS